MFAQRDNYHTHIAEGDLGVNTQNYRTLVVPLFRFDLTGALADGENELCIEVATTLERENSKIPDVTGQVKTPTALSGITGTVHVWQITG